MRKNTNEIKYVRINKKKSFQRKDNHTQGIEISNGELYAVQQTTGKARIIEEKKRKI